MSFVVAVALATVAIGRALTVPAPPAGQPITEAQAHWVYESFCSQESAARAKAAENFAADPWSQDDDFFAHERGLATAFANTQGVRRQDAFAAVDRGMREKWPLPPGVPAPLTHVTPCKPRAIE